MTGEIFKCGHDANDFDLLVIGSDDRPLTEAEVALAFAAAMRADNEWDGEFPGCRDSLCLTMY
jgi:hypothetical protein